MRSNTKYPTLRGAISICANIAVLLGSALSLPAGPPTYSSGVHRVIFQREDEYNADKPMGDGLQQKTGMAQCREQPNIIYLTQDMGAPTVSVDGGKTWYLPHWTGMRTQLTQGVMCDPLDPRRVAVVTNESYLEQAGEGGLYVSFDGGQTATRKVVWPGASSVHAASQGIGFHPASESNGRADNWIFIGPATTTTYEATTPVGANSGDGAEKVSDTNASGDAFLRYNANATNDYVTLNVGVPFTGTYQVKIRFKKASSHGKYQLAIDGTNQGAVQDLYNSTDTFVEVDLGTKDLTVGTRAFKFTVTGKNASSSDYRLGVDQVNLYPYFPIHHSVGAMTETSWPQRGSLLSSVTYGLVKHVIGDPLNNNRYLVAFSTGLYWLNNAHTGSLSLTKISGTGSLPTGAVNGPPYISTDGQTIIAGVQNNGVYKSIDGGSTWSLVSAQSDLHKLFVNWMDPDDMAISRFVIGTGGTPLFSRDGATFSAPTTIEKRPGFTNSLSPGYQHNHVAWIDGNGELWYAGRHTSVGASNNDYRSSDGGQNLTLSMKGMLGMQLGSLLNGAAQIFDPADKNRIGLPGVDFGWALSTDGLKSMQSFSIAAVADGGVRINGTHTTVHGAILHPTLDRAVVGMDTGTKGYLYVYNNGTWSHPSAGVSDRYHGLCFDADTKVAFGGELRSADWVNWSTTGGPGTGYKVVGCTLGISGGHQAIFAIDEGASTKSRNLKRTLDDGATAWEIVLTANYALMGGVGYTMGPFIAHPTNKDIVFTKDPTGTKIRQWDLSGGTVSNRPYVDLDPLDGATESFTLNGMAIDPRYPNIIYARNGEHGSGYKLLRSTSSGASGTWANLSSLVPDGMAPFLSVHPLTGEVFLSGGSGMWLLDPPYAQSGKLGGSLQLAGNMLQDNYLGIGLFETSADIGTVSAVGSAAYDSDTGTYTVVGSGANIYNANDEFRYLYKAQSGDATMIARVTGVQNTGSHPKAALMMRESTAANSAHATVAVTASDRIEFLRRTATGNTTTDNTYVTGQSAPKWIKLTRSGGNFSAYYSSDGASWTQVGTAAAVTIGNDYLAGLAACSVTDGTLNTCTFTNVSIVNNIAPVGVSDSYSVNEGATHNVSAPGVLANDTDANGDPLTAVKLSDPAHGSLTLNSNGSFTYIHDGSDTTSDSFTYQADDGTATSATTTVSLTINPVNDAPSFTKGANQTVMANTGAQTVTGWATAIGSGEAGQMVNFIVSNNNTSLFSSQPAISAAGTLTFTPVSYVSATDYAIVSVQIHDDGGTANGGVDTSAVQTFTITVNPYTVNGLLPQDIGGPGLAGSSSYSGGTYTISGGGTDIYGTADKFHFLGQAWTGDVRFMTRVVSQTSPQTNNWAKAGLMLRDDNATGSRHVLLDTSPAADLGGSIQMLSRSTANGTTAELGRYDGNAMPYWLRLERHGDVFTGWYSLDGTLWLTAGSTSLTLNSPALAGLAVTAHDNTKLNTAVFDNVVMQAPPVWTAADVGSVGTTGSTSIDYATDVFTLNGAGSNIYNAADSFHFCYLTLTGDATIIAEVSSVELTNQYAKGGLMIRQSLTNNSVHATIAIKPGDGASTGVEFLCRTTSGGNTVHSSGSPVAGVVPPRFLKLVRSGNSFTAYQSDAGSVWTQVGLTETINMSGTVYVGLIVCSIDTGNLCTATFESVFVK